MQRMQQKTTGNLLEELLQTEKLDSYMEENRAELLDTTRAQELQKLMEGKPFSKADLAFRSGLSRVYIYQIFSGVKVPSRDSLICLCFALELEPDEIMDLFKHTGYPALYPRDRRDSVILFAASRHKTLIELEDMLEQQGLSGMQR